MVLYCWRAYWGCSAAKEEVLGRLRALETSTPRCARQVNVCAVLCVLLEVLEVTLVVSGVLEFSTPWCATECVVLRASCCRTPGGTGGTGRGTGALRVLEETLSAYCWWMYS